MRPRNCYYTAKVYTETVPEVYTDSKEQPPPVGSSQEFAAVAVAVEVVVLLCTVYNLGEEEHLDCMEYPHKEKNCQ